MLDLKLTQSVIRGKLDAVILDARGYPDAVKQVSEVYARFKDASQVRSVLDKYPNLVKECNEVAYPLEDEKTVDPPMEVGGFKPSEADWARKVLDGEVVFGVDTSEIPPSTHRSPSFLLINVGFSVMRYAERTFHVEGSRSYFYPYSELVDLYAEGQAIAMPSWAVDVTRIGCESDVLKGVKQEVGMVHQPFVLFDESFSASYLSTVSQTRRAKVVKRMDEMHDDLLRMGIAPVGVFYTSSSAFVTMVRHGLRRGSDGKDQDFEWRRVRDSLFFMNFLLPGWRSPAFMVRNRVGDEFGRRIVGFYLKAGLDSIIRVEFPDVLFGQIESVHRIVAAQSALGGGYPYVLQRAHEKAYMTPGERQWIFDYMNRLIGEETGIGDAVKLSKKQMRKIVGVV